MTNQYILVGSTSINLSGNGGVGTTGGTSGSPIYGEMTLINNSTSVHVPVGGTYVPLTGLNWTYDQAPSNITYNLSNGAMTANASAVFSTEVCGSAHSNSGGNTIYNIAIFKNGVIVTDHVVTVTLLVSSSTSFAITGIDAGQVGDVYQLMINNMSVSDGYVTFVNINNNMAAIAGSGANGTFVANTDLTGSNTSQIVKSAQSGTIAFGTSGLITLASTATVPGLTQASTSSSATPQNITITPQASTATNGSTGDLILALATPQSGGSDGAFLITRGGTDIARIGPYATPTFTSLYFGSNATSPGTTNYAFLVDNAGTSTYVNGATTLYLSIAGSVGATMLTAGNAQLSLSANWNLGVGTNVFGSGHSVIGLANATTNPTGAISGGGVIYVDHTTGNLMFIGSSGVARTIAAA